MLYKKPQTAKLVDISKKHHRSVAFRAYRAVYRLFEEGYAITVYNVSKESGIPMQTIYSDKDLIGIIDYYGKYVQAARSITPENFGAIENPRLRGLFKEDLEDNLSIPDLNVLESRIEKLLSENTKLKLTLLSLENELKFYESGGTQEEWKELIRKSQSDEND